MTAERDRLRDEMLKRGGVLLRGFEVNEPTGFADIIGALGYQPEADNPFDTSPRSKVAESVYTSTDTPNAYPILAHNENSFLNERPRMISFFSGRTPPLRRDAAVQLARCRRDPRPQHPGEARGKKGLLSAASSEEARPGHRDEPRLERGFRNLRPR